MKTCDLLCGGLHGSLQKEYRKAEETITHLTSLQQLWLMHPLHLNLCECLFPHVYHIKMEAGKLIQSCFAFALEKRRQLKARKLGWWQGMFCQGESIVIWWSCYWDMVSRLRLFGIGLYPDFPLARQLFEPDIPVSLEEMSVFFLQTAKLSSGFHYRIH